MSDRRTGNTLLGKPTTLVSFGNIHFPICGDTALRQSAADTHDVVGNHRDKRTAVIIDQLFRFGIQLRLCRKLLIVDGLVTER